MKIVIDTKDLNKIDKVIKKIIKESPDELDSLLKETVSEMEGHARQLAPVKSGHLRRNIKKSGNKNNYELKSEADYSLFVEYGNRYHPGTPFFRSAIEKSLANFKDKVSRSFNI